MQSKVVFELLVLNFLISFAFATKDFNNATNASIVALGLSEIIHGLSPKNLVIYTGEQTTNEAIDDLMHRIQQLHYQTCTFDNQTKFFRFIAMTISLSVESTSLIFMNPQGFVEQLHENKLAHRLSLFMFYWGARSPPSARLLRFEEPLRVVIISRPRERAFRVFYNQATPSGVSNLKLVNWYDGDSLGLIKTPLLPSTSTVYSDLNGRVFRIPVIHAPPWFFVDYNRNDSYVGANSLQQGNNKAVCKYYHPEISESSRVCVIGGRDHNLLMNLARKMNFKIEYMDPPERTQGSPIRAGETDVNFNFSGGIGMLQDKSGDMLLGDISLNWERGKAVEFSFFTLADSVAFATHAPRRLNEALAIIRPFKLDVWPYLILTVILSGPVFYFMIKIPEVCIYSRPKTNRRPRLLPFSMDYINEITYYRKKVSLSGGIKKKQKKSGKSEEETNLLGRCIWFTLQLFLKQACSEPHHSRRTRFLTIVFWIAATYVLADVYSAQLTSQFARPAREAPINSLENLERAMRLENYQLFVEEDSSALQLLENGTEVFRRLYKLMKRQAYNKGKRGFLIGSVEKGIEKIVDGSQKVILGGRETLFFNIKKYGPKKFQLSHKLFTRYSAMAVQIGCPFLETINDILIRLFEGGVLDKLTDTEYEAMSKLLSLNKDESKAEDSIEENELSSKEDSQGAALRFEEDDIIQPINLRMLQGAFIVLIFGNLAATISLVLEILSITHRFECMQKEWRKKYRKIVKRSRKMYALLKWKLKQRLCQILNEFLY